MGRLSYIVGFSTVRLIPLPDYNYVRPIGVMGRANALERSALVSKQIEDRITCLYQDKEGCVLITFCARTGKFIAKH